MIAATACYRPPSSSSSSFNSSSSSNVHGRDAFTDYTKHSIRNNRTRRKTKTIAVVERRSLGTSSENVRETLVNEISRTISENNNSTIANDLIQVGAVIAAHGLKGEVRIFPETDFIEERFMNPGVDLYVENVAQGRASKNAEFDRPIAEGKFMRVVTGRWVTSKGRTEPIVQFKGCSDRTQAESMIGRRIYIAKDNRPVIEEEDEFYAQQLEGLTVIMHEGEREVIGVVEDIYRGAGEKDLLKVIMQPVLETKTNKNGEVEYDIVEYYVFIPFVKDIVPVVDIDQGLIEITPPPGLLDLKQKIKNK
jgi:16S rRNA processing protein RimM